MFHNKCTDLGRRHGSSSVSSFAVISHLGLQGQGEKRPRKAGMSPSEMQLWLMTPWFDLFSTSKALDVLVPTHLQLCATPLLQPQWTFWNLSKVPSSLSLTSLPWVNWSFYLHIDTRGLASCLACAKCAVNTGCNPSYAHLFYGWPPYYSLKIPLSFPWHKMYWICINSVTTESTFVPCHHCIPIFWQC